MSVLTRRIYCVPCNEVCPFLEAAMQATWQEEHAIQKHSPKAGPDPLGKGAHFAPVPANWG